MIGILEAETDEQLEIITKKIARAQEYALKHFNADRCHDYRMFDENFEPLPPSFFVEFPAPDRLICTPSLFGTPGGIWFEYRLYFGKSGSLTWRGKHPFNPHISLAPIVVPEEF